MNLKRLAETSPVIGAFLIFLGYLKLHLYYSHWGVNIASYLDFSEITLSFLNDTNTILFFTLLLLLQMTVGIVTLSTIDDKIKVSDNSSNSSGQKFEGIIPAIDKVFEEHPSSFVILTSILTTVFFVLFLCFLNLIFLYLTFVFFIQLVVLFLDNIVGIKNNNSLVQTAFVIILLSFTWCLASYSIKQTEVSTQRTILQLSSTDSICSNENFIFLGKTNNYYLFFDKLKNKSTILPETTVLRTTIAN